MVKYWITLSFWESKKYVVVDDDDNDNNDNNDDDDSESDTWGSFAAFSRNTSLLSKTIRFTCKYDDDDGDFLLKYPKAQLDSIIPDSIETYAFEASWGILWMDMSKSTTECQTLMMSPTCWLYVNGDDPFLKREDLSNWMIFQMFPKKSTSSNMLILSSTMKSVFAAISSLIPSKSSSNSARDLILMSLNSHSVIHPPQ